jgi:outer membrane protein TolC
MNNRKQSTNLARPGRHRFLLNAGLLVAVSFGSTLQAGEPAVTITVSEVPPGHVGESKAPHSLLTTHQPAEPAPAPRPLGAQEKLYPLPVEPIVKGAPPRRVVEDLAEAGPVVPPAQEDQIDLSTALKLAEAENPQIAMARQAIKLALAQQLQARALVLPHLRAGVNYHKHDGVLQNSFGLMRHVEEESLYFGGGARALAAETVAFPAVQFSNHLGDAFFEPLVARQFVAVKEYQASASANAVLLETALRYLDLLNAEGELAALKQSEREMDLIVQTTAIFAKQGAGRDADAKRARTEALLLHSERQAAEERTALAAAELARVLHLDPSTRLRSPAKTIALLPLVEPDLTLEQLIAIAQRERPELAAIRAEIARKSTQVRQERLRPLLPTVAVGYSAGGFGGGTNRTDLVPIHPQFGRIGSRADFDVIAYWSVQNMGAGNLALARTRQTERQIAEVEQVRLLNQVRREVATALALTEARRRQVDIAQQRLDAAEKGFREDYQRTRAKIGLPIEVLNSMNRLVQARSSFIQSLAGYNQSQFQLFVALGQTPLAATGRAVAQKQ